MLCAHNSVTTAELNVDFVLFQARWRSILLCVCDASPPSQLLRFQTIGDHGAPLVLRVHRCSLNEVFQKWVILRLLEGLGPQIPPSTMRQNWRFLCSLQFLGRTGGLARAVAPCAGVRDQGDLCLLRASYTLQPIIQEAAVRCFLHVMPAQLQTGELLFWILQRRSSPAAGCRG
jgi:hypothetical protein